MSKNALQDDNSYLQVAADVVLNDMVVFRKGAEGQARINRQVALGGRQWQFWRERLSVRLRLLCRRRSSESVQATENQVARRGHGQDRFLPIVRDVDAAGCRQAKCG
jgi:hypothetical protein